MFIDEMIDRKEKEMRNMEDQLELLRADRMAVSSLRGSTARYAHTVPEFVFSSFLHQGTSSSTSLLTGIDSDMDPMLRMKNRVLKHFDSLQDSYSAIRMKHKSSDVQVTPNDDQTNSVDGDFLLSVEDRLGVFGEVVRGVARYGQVHRVATLNYDVELAPQMSIVSSAIARLATYPGTPIRRAVYVVAIMRDMYLYGMYTRNYQEHEKRVWTVHFNNVDPHLIASGSDDAKVKLWSMNCDRSVMTIDAKVNVCCVYFSPSSRHHLVYGSAGQLIFLPIRKFFFHHCVHLYDIRNTSKAVNIFRGHRKAVSYVRFINEDEVVSASTDSNLRVWCARTGRCTRVMRGHVNEKNFVGLSGGGDHVVCGKYDENHYVGSENNRAYFYYKGIGEPMVTYDVGMELGKESNEAEVSDGFVSSVCWKKNSDNVLVANSQGKVHVLRQVLKKSDSKNLLHDLKQAEMVRNEGNLLAAKLLLKANSLDINGKLDFTFLAAIIETSPIDRLVEIIRQWMKLYKHRSLGNSEDELMMYSSLMRVCFKNKSQLCELMTAVEMKQLRRYFLFSFLIMHETDHSQKLFIHGINFIALTMTPEEQLFELCIYDLPAYFRGKYRVINVLANTVSNKQAIFVIILLINDHLKQLVDQIASQMHCQLVADAAADLICLLVKRMPTSSIVRNLLTAKLIDRKSSIRSNAFRWVGRLEVCIESHQMLTLVSEDIIRMFEIDENIWPPYSWETEINIFYYRFKRIFFLEEFIIRNGDCEHSELLYKYLLLGIPEHLCDSLFWYCVDVQNHDYFTLRSSATILFGIYLSLHFFKIFGGFYILKIVIFKDSVLFCSVFSHIYLLATKIATQSMHLSEFISSRIIFLLSFYYSGINVIRANVLGILNMSTDLRERRFCMDILAALCTSHMREVIFQKLDTFVSSTIMDEADLRYFRYLFNRVSGVFPHSAELSLQAAAMALVRLVERHQNNWWSYPEKEMFVDLCIFIFSHTFCSSRVCSIMSRIPVVLKLTTSYMQDYYVIEVISTPLVDRIVVAHIFVKIPQILDEYS
uniref:WD_REPEATS_REGION domain-containing protein n=1 Tax=Heterorhabditis bacteriophora TaxID=37862 RepID=A0A1I7WYH2_HETBA